MKLIESPAPPSYILGEDADRREWLVHLHAPRFACRVRQLSDDLPVFSQAENERPDEVIFDFGEEALCDFIWFDEPPSERHALHRILTEAADFVEMISAADMAEDDE